MVEYLHSPFASRIQCKVEVEGLARDSDLYGGGPCSFVNGGNNSISNTILEEASSDALARDPVKVISQVLPWLKIAFPTKLVR